MRRHLIGVVTAAALVAILAGGALAQEPSATVRTYQGLSFKVADPSLEVFYTIGDLPEKKDEKAGPVISMTTSTTGPPPMGETASGGAGGEKEAKLLRGHSQATEFTVWKEGAASRIRWDRIKTMFFTRKPVNVAGLPPYISHYRYGVSVTLIDGEKVDADYVNLGTIMLRGKTANGHVDIPWEDIENVIIER